MAEFEFSLRVVSPAFVAGAIEERTSRRDRDGNPVMKRVIGPLGPNGEDGEDAQDGLRIPSLRGVLRFWFRAMHGGDNDLFDKEARLFGSVQNGQGIRLIPISSSCRYGRIGGDADMIGGKDGRGYLGFGPILRVSREEGFSSYNDKYCRDAIRENSAFTFKAVGRDRQLLQLKKLLTLLHLFGGIGGRSRRAWGSLQVLGDFIPKPETSETVHQWFSRALQVVFPTGFAASHAGTPKFSAFSGQTDIRVSKLGQADYSAVMHELFRQFAKTRLYFNPFDPGTKSVTAQNDHDLEVSDSAGNDVSRIPLRLAFGLPFHPGRKRNDGSYIWHIEYEGRPPTSTSANEEKPVDRRASPLIFKVLPFKAANGETRYHAVLLFLKAQFFGADHLEVGQKRGGVTKPFTSATWKAIEEFLNNPNWQQVPLP